MRRDGAADASVVRFDAVLTGVGLGLLCVPVRHVAEAERHDGQSGEQSEHDHAEQRSRKPQLVQVVTLFGGGRDRGCLLYTSRCV